jgi:hypothetical protein
MKLLLLLILFHTPQYLLILYTHGLQQRCEVVYGEVPVRTAVGLSWSRWMFRQDLLATVWRIPVSSPIRVSSYIPICVTDIVSVFFVKSIVRDLIEPLSPEQ